MRASGRGRAINDYLRRLAAASRGLRRGDWRELRAQIEEHLQLALPAAPSEDEVRTVLERLGDPEEIVAEQYGHQSAPRGMGAIVLLLIGRFPGRHRLAGRRGALVDLSRVDDQREADRHAACRAGCSAAPSSRRWVPGGSGPSSACPALVLPLRSATHPALAHTVSRCTTGGASPAIDVLGVALFALLILVPFGTAIFLPRRARPLAV